MREGMGGEFAPIDPASHPEDWDVLTEKLLRSTWRTPLEGREIMLKMLTVDSGGEEGVTHNAYAWYRRLRAEKLHHRVMLYKGASEPKAPILRESMVGKRGGKTKADIPLYQCNPNLLSDAVDAGLRRDTPGPGYIHFPPPKHPKNNPNGWLPASFFDELKSEVRLASGVWSQIRKRNESFDLCRMIRAAMLKLGIDKVDWNRVPPWLAPLDQNSLVITVEDRREMKANERVPEPAPVVQVIRPRAKKQRRSSLPTFLR
jgi:phage terminase large subunit GpA-like protein